MFSFKVHPLIAGQGSLHTQFKIKFQVFLQSFSMPGLSHVFLQVVGKWLIWSPQWPPCVIFLGEFLQVTRHLVVTRKQPLDVTVYFLISIRQFNLSRLLGPLLEVQNVPFANCIDLAPNCTTKFFETGVVGNISQIYLQTSG